MGPGEPWRSRVPVLQLLTLSGSAQRVPSSGTKGNILTSTLANMAATHTVGGVSGEAGEGVPTPDPPGPSAPSPSSRSVAGAHLNPAFSLTVCWLGLCGRADLRGFQLHWSHLCPPLWYGEVSRRPAGDHCDCAGAVGLMESLCSSDAIGHHINGTLAASGPWETTSIFASSPADSLCNAFLDQVGAAVTESQNGQGWKGPMWVIWSNALPKQGHPEPAAQQRVQGGSNNSREGDSSSPAPKK